MIEDDAQERWAKDYRTQAVLDLDDFTVLSSTQFCTLTAGGLSITRLRQKDGWSYRPIDGGESPGAAHPNLPRDTAKLIRKGIRVNRMWYAPDDAEGLTIGDSYTIAYDPADLRRIHIILADKICPCHTVEIGQLLSACEVSVAHEAAKKNREAARMRETASSIATTQAIRAIIEHADEHREPIRQVDGEQIKQDQIKERGQLSE